MTDSQRLLADYVKNGSGTAFRELVNRYLNLVYSTALRLVKGDCHRAEDVAQTVFMDLARMAATLAEDVMLGGWLHRHACFVAANTMRGERRRQIREREAIEMNALQDHSEANLTLVAPILDEAINGLDDADRTAILLRFFEQCDFRSVGEALGSSEDAARMRVTRALDKLQAVLKRRGVTTSAAALSVVLSAHAVQAAPAGLGAAISTAAGLTATTLSSATTIGVTKTIAMTTTQKILIAVTTAGLAVTAGTSVYQTRRVSQVQEQLAALQQQQEPLTQQVEQLRQERDDAQKQIAQLRRDTAELPRLRSQVTRLTDDSRELARLKAASTQPADAAAARMPNAAETQKEIDPTELAAKLWAAKVNQLKQGLEQMPDKKIPELQLLSPDDWLDAARRQDLQTDTDMRKALSSLRQSAKGRFAHQMGLALSQYAEANGGLLPSDISQLAPYFQPPVDDAILHRYQVVSTGPLSEVSQEDLPVAEKAPVDDQYDTLFKIGPNSYRLQGTGSLSGMTGAGTWRSPPRGNVP